MATLEIRARNGLSRGRLVAIPCGRRHTLAALVCTTTAEPRLRGVGTFPPAHGLIEQSGVGSGQYEARSTCEFPLLQPRNPSEAKRRFSLLGMAPSSGSAKNAQAWRLTPPSAPILVSRHVPWLAQFRVSQGEAKNGTNRRAAELLVQWRKPSGLR